MTLRSTRLVFAALACLVLLGGAEAFARPGRVREETATLPWGQVHLQVGKRGIGRVTIGNGGIQAHTGVGIVQQSQHLTLPYPHAFLGVHAGDTRSNLGGNRGAPPRRHVAARIQKRHPVVASARARHRNFHQRSLALQHNEKS